MACSLFHRFLERLRTVFRRPVLMEKVDLQPQHQPTPLDAVDLQNQIPPLHVAGHGLPPPGNHDHQSPLLGPSHHHSNASSLLKRCNLCLEHLDVTPANFPFKCPQCNSSQYCAVCIKSWFLEACKNESKMPPRCCSIIPSSAVKKMMAVEEVSKRSLPCIQGPCLTDSR